MILKTLHALGPLHGFGIARRLEQVSRDVLQLNEGTVYTALLRLQQQGWIAAEWGTSENNRKAKFYSITRRGRKQLEVETENWGSTARHSPSSACSARRPAITCRGGSRSRAPSRRTRSIATSALCW
jgi:PadR family transcriptional regulator